MEPGMLKQFFPLTCRQTRKAQKTPSLNQACCPLPPYGMRLGSVTALVGYVGQLVCQFLWVSGLWLAQCAPIDAMDRNDRFQSSSSSSPSSYSQDGAIDAGFDFPPNPLSGESSDAQSNRAESSNSGQFYQDGDHPLTQEVWKGKDLSARLKPLRLALEDLKKRMGERGYITKKPEEFTQEDWASYVGIFEGCVRKTHTEFFKCRQCSRSLVEELTHIHGGTGTFEEFGNLESIAPQGLSGNKVLLWTRETSNILAIKKFTNKEGKPHKIEEGLKELLDSLFAHIANPLSSHLKIARIYDAILCPENSFSLIMEGSNTHDIHHYLATPLASDAVRACAHYLAMFHTGNYQKAATKISQMDYIRHKAEAFKKLSDNPLKDGGVELLSRAGSQSLDIQNVTAGNIIQLLTEEEQKRFEGLYHKNLKDFEANCGEIFRSLNGNLPRGQFYFLTKTHGDAHGNNFFYNGAESLTDNEGPLDKDSFYRVSMIDFSSITRTYGGIGDPAEDLGRFMGSLWDWAARPVDSEDPEALKFKAYETIYGLQEEFWHSYLHIIMQNKIIPEENRDQFAEILKTNSAFYKLRFYKAIFNSRKSKDTKLTILKSWMEEQGSPSLQDQHYPVSHETRPWEQVAEEVIHNRLPNKVEGFIESGAQGSSGSYLTRLWKKFNLYRLETAALSSTISGMGGIGKTSLALAYAYEALENKGYNLIYWLQSETESSLLNGYQELDQRIAASEGSYPAQQGERNPMIRLVKAIEEKKASSRDKWLLVYDNVPHPGFLKGKVPQKPNIDVLITSRCAQGWEQEPLNPSVFSPEDAATYLLQTIGLADNEVNRLPATHLGERLGYFPLALSHAGGYIKLVGGDAVSIHKTIEDYIEKFNNPFAGHFEENANPFNPVEMTYENLVRKTFEISKGEVSELARELVAYCAYLEPDSIVEDLFIHGLKGFSEIFIIAHEFEDFSEDFFIRRLNRRLSEKDIKDAFNQLCSFSLLKRNPLTESKSTISMHRLLQFIIKQEEEKRSNSKKLDKLVWIFNKLRNTFDQGGELTTLELCADSIKNLKHVNEYLKQRIVEVSESRSKEIFSLKRQYADLLENFERYKMFCPEFNEDLLKFCEEEGMFKEINSPLYPKNTQENIDEQAVSQLIGIGDGVLQYGQDAIIEALSQIDTSQHQSILESAGQLIVEHMGNYERASIIEVLGKIREPERQGVIESVKQLITEGKITFNQYSVIQAVRQINESERLGIIESAKQLLTKNTDGLRWGFIIFALSQINESERLSIIESAKHLITQDIDEWDCYGIIEALNKINRSERLEVVEYAKQIIAPDMNGINRVFVIETLGQINRPERLDFMKSAKKLITPGMDGPKRILVIETLKTLSMNHTENKEEFERNKTLNAAPTEPRIFELEVHGKKFNFKEVVIPGNGDCGYLAMGTTRSEATDLLLKNSHREDIRALVADEIYDMFATLPNEMTSKSHYKNIHTSEKELDHEFRDLISHMNDLIEQPENNRLSEDEVFSYFSKMESENKINNQQEKSLKILRVLKERRKILEYSKKDYCNTEEVFKLYVETYMQPSVQEFLSKNKEPNWLNSTNVPGRNSSADAIAHLMKKNFVIMNEHGLIEHEYYTQDIPIENILVLLHIRNWHFNKLESIL